jgi:hypothetical protein
VWAVPAVNELTNQPRYRRQKLMNSLFRIWGFPRRAMPLKMMARRGVGVAPRLYAHNASATSTMTIRIHGSSVVLASVSPSRRDIQRSDMTRASDPHSQGYSGPRSDFQESVHICIVSARNVAPCVSLARYLYIYSRGIPLREYPRRRLPARV